MYDSNKKWKDGVNILSVRIVGEAVKVLIYMKI